MPKVDIQKITYRIEQAIKELLDEVTTEKFWVTHYGANDIHPKHLVYWICIESDEERRRLTNSYQLNTELKALLVLHNYPIEGRDGVRIGFESQETVDRESIMPPEFWTKKEAVLSSKTSYEKAIFTTI